MKRLNIIFILTAVIIIWGNNIFAQLYLPRLSPQASIMQNIGITKVEIRYNRPAVRERVIWGDLVPYNKIWRTGANEATTIEFSTDVKVNGNIVPKGKYSLYTIPGETEWTVILNKQWDQWGLDYDKYVSEDLLRFKVKPETCDFYERMLFYFSNTSRKTADLNLAWEKLKISFSIESYLTTGDDKKVRLSPTASVYQTVGYTDFILTFGSPAVNNRAIWGALVPYNKVWRAGANEATTIEFSTPVSIQGTPVPAGKYAIFTIPAENEWTIILNKKWNQWGLDYEKNKSEDLIQFKARPEKNSFNERLFFKFLDFTDSSATIALIWENIKVPFKINISLEDIALKQIQNSLLKAKEGDWRIFLDAAEYAVDNNFFNSEPLKWIDKSLSINETYKAYFIKAEYFYKNRQFTEALKQIDKCRDKGQSEKDYQSFLSRVDDLERKVKENN